MATAKKLPSGSWRCQVFSGFEETILPDGTRKKKRIYKSFTDPDPSLKGKRKCEAAAAAWAVEKEMQSPKTSLTFGQALDDYIEKRSAVLSPATIREYKRQRKHDFSLLENKRVPEITQADIQLAMNTAAIDHSPKTVRNMHGLISAVLNVYRPDFRLKTDLPKKVRPKIYVPSDDELKRILIYAKETDPEMEIAILLAAFGPMRRGEISALDSDHIHGNIVHVEFSMALDEHNHWIIKRPKSYAGDRYIDYPAFVIDKFSNRKGPIVLLDPAKITNRFESILRHAGVPHFRFHDLRHYSASIQHALGIPDAYIMQRGGWGNDGVLKSVYRHVMEEQAIENSSKINSYFENLCNTECNTKTKNP